MEPITFQRGRHFLVSVARAAAPSLAALAISLAVSALLITLAGGSAADALAALGSGAFGSASGWSETAVKTCPLLLTGIAVAIAFRTGIWNIGAEGQLLIGATLTAWLGTRAAGLPRWLGLPAILLASAAGGAAWAWLAALLKVRRGVSEVISTIMLNFVALGLVSYLVHGPLQEASGAYPQSEALALALRLPRLAAGLRVHAGLLLALGVAAGAYVLLFRTVAGYELRATGMNATAARLAGIRTNRSIYLALLLSGAVAGLAGGVEVNAVTFRLYERFSPGYGFTAIAVALLGRLHPAGIVLAAFLFGALEAGSGSMQRVAGVSSVLVSVIQGVVIFALIGVEHARWLDVPGEPRDAPPSTPSTPG